MSIDEAIERCETLATNGQNIFPRDPDIAEDCNEKYKQLAEWFEELKFLKQWKSDIMDSFCKYDVNSFEELVANTRNKTIDDFVKEICKMIVQSENNGNYRFYAVEIKQAIADLAEQLKEGGNIELQEHSKSQVNRTGK